MKGPKRRISNLEYSTLVVTGCTAIGAILMAIISITSTDIGLLGKILTTVFLICVSIFCVMMIIYQIKNLDDDEGEK